MTTLIDRLKNPELHYPGNFDTPARANAVLMSLCQEAADALAAPVQEPVAYQQRTRPNWMDETCWTPWEDCSKSEAEDCWNRPRVHDWLYEARAIYTTPLAQPAPVQRCTSCDGTGDVHDQTGEWRGTCHCEAGQAIKAKPPAAQPAPMQSVENKENT